MDRISYSIGRLKAPARDGEILTNPPLVQCVPLAISNARQLQESVASIGGRPLAEFRRWTRAVLLKMAGEYVASLTQSHVSGLPDLQAPLIVTGHQPGLTHPGVWAKNLATWKLAEAGQGSGLNLIVDNDSAGRMSIDLPAGTIDEPRFHAVEFDRPGPESPWEEILVQDEALFASFANRVSTALAQWKQQSELTEIWPAVVHKMQTEKHLSTLLTCARVVMEQRRGIYNLELPVSLLSDSEPFLYFVVHLLQLAQPFQQAYNESLTEYRREYKLHSIRHPVPDLETRDGWTELPFWGWKSGDQERQRLYCLRHVDGLRISNGTEVIWHLNWPVGQEYPGETGTTRVVQQLAHMQQTWKIRPRALTLTLFARLALADLFIHGIGGAKYDEVTDRIMEKFLGIRPPAYSVVTATMHLPQEELPVSFDRVQQLRHQLRNMKYNPQAYLAREEISELLNARDRLLEEKSSAPYEPASLRRERHRQLTRIREELFMRVENQRERCQNQLHTAEQKLSAAKVLKFREFATVLFSSARLDRLCQEVRINS